MWDQRKPGPQYEQLSQAIIHAILSSKEVQERIGELQEQGALDGEDILALAIRFPSRGGLEAKVELMRKNDAEASDVEDDEAELMAEIEEGVVPRENGKKQGKSSGRSKTPNEIAFENYLQEKFDEQGWMKQAGIRFLKEENEGIPLHEGDAQESDAE